ncbi:unnamed protein product [Staurois parvus]|uniref:MI domain-containing protein n=1 Tax=Staurois parvus TaxID=386267 RepID=A0ABN9GP98_9NEOB|nr:unnamed protein product [Staurois parvus]
MGKGRGLPKKGGAGGKGVWGAPGQIYSYQEPDIRDPNYDESAQGDTVYQKVVPELDEAELQKAVHPMVQEYFEHGDTGEVIALLRGLNLGGQRPEVPRLAVSLSLEGKASHRELTSRLLSDLLGKVLTEEDMARAFDRLLINLPDLILDTPEAPQMLGQFIARAVADHALHLNFLDRYKGRVDCDHARAALDRAAVLLRIKREIIRLDNVWGVGGGQRPVKHLVKEMNLLLQEFLSSGQMSEAERCLRDLEVPHFHHELVYEAVVMVLEGSAEGHVMMVVKLLKALYDSGLITLDQMNRVTCPHVYHHVLHACAELGAHSSVSCRGSSASTRSFLISAWMYQMPRTSWRNWWTCVIRRGPSPNSCGTSVRSGVCEGGELRGGVLPVPED